MFLRPFLKPEKIGQEIAKRAPGLFYTTAAGAVGGVGAVTATIATSDAKLIDKIRKISDTAPKAAIYGGTAGFLFSAGLRKFPLSTASSTSAAALSQARDFLSAIATPSVQLKR